MERVLIDDAPGTLRVEQPDLPIGLRDKNGQPLKSGDRVRVRYWHGFEFIGIIQYHRRYAGFAVESDPLMEMDFDKGTTVELLLDNEPLGGEEGQ